MSAPVFCGAHGCHAGVSVDPGVRISVSGLLELATETVSTEHVLSVFVRSVVGTILAALVSGLVRSEMDRRRAGLFW